MIYCCSLKMFDYNCFNSMFGETPIIICAKESCSQKILKKYEDLLQHDGHPKITK